MVTLILLILLALAGCVDGDRDDRSAKDAATEGELLARVSAAIRVAPRSGAGGGWEAIAYADLATAREQLGLPEDAGISGPGKQHLLFSFAARPLFRLGTLFGPTPSLGPLGEVLDDGQIEVAVGTNFAFSSPVADQIGPGDVLVVRTRQPFGEIADRLRRRAGYDEAPDGLLVGGEPIDRDGDLRVATSYDGFPFPAAGDAGGGVVVFGGSARAVRAAIQGSGAELTAAAKLLAELPGVARVAGGGPFRADCVVAIGLGEDAAPREGAVVVIVEGEARPERLPFGGLTGHVDLPR